MLAGYSLTSWGQKDGLPPSVIWTIAEDSEGYLWLGTDAGLLRFDGLRFVQWEPDGLTPLPKASVRSVSTTRDGSIWVGFGEPGGVSRITKRNVRNYGESDGIGLGAVTTLFEDAGGNVWAGNRSGLYRFAEDRWEPAGAGLPTGAVLYSAYVDRRGEFFVATPSGAFRRTAGQSRFRNAERVDRVVRHLAEDTDGRLWVSDPVIGFRRLNDPDMPTRAAEKGQGSRLLRDSRGNLWVGTFGQGLWRVRFDPTTATPIVERTSTLTGFSDDGVTAIIEDREGNIWAGTYDGLDRLTPHKLAPVMNLGVIRGIEETPEGNVWVGTVDALIEFAPGKAEPRRRPAAFNGAPPSAMHTDERGTLWVATNRDLLRFVHGKWSSVRFPADKALRQITAITSDLQGGVWLYDRDRGVVRWNSGRLEPLTLPAALRNIAVVATLTDRSARLWLSFDNGRVAVVNRDGTIQLYDAQDGLEADVYRALFEDAGGTVWLGGNHGLSWSSGNRFVTLGAANGFPAGSVIGIVEDQSGRLWLALEGAGIVRINRTEIGRASRVHTYQVRFSYYDKFDGFAGAPRWFGNSSAARGQDGRLWFISARGVTVVDPDKLNEAGGAPIRVDIERVVADAQRVRGLSQARLPPRTAQVEIDYTVPNLSSPLKTRFRYRLEGFDADWIEAGNRRQAFYTNLPPREYRFRVTASNSDGTWSEPGTAFDFSILPRFYQTTLFSIASIAGLGLAGWAAWRLRIRKVRKQFSLLLAERARLGREIHDTLLQGLFGMALQCDAIANDLGHSQPAIRERMIQLRTDAEEYVREARNSIRDLRSPKLQRSDLVDALREAGERVTAGNALEFTFAVSGEPYRFSATAEEQLLRVGQEAVVNAARHAQAREVRVDVMYQPTSITLRVSDNGCGFDPSAFSEPDGHCGLASMRERMETVGGGFRIASVVGRGTDIEAVVPRSADT